MCAISRRHPNHQAPGGTISRVMMSDVTIREPPSLADYRESLRVVADAWHAGFDDIVSTAALERMDQLEHDPETEQHYECYRSHHGMAQRLAYDGDAVVGAGSIIWAPAQTKEFVDPSSAEIRTLYVHPDRWRTGIGTALLHELVAIPPPKFDRIVLETFAENAHGRSFYRANGFSPCGTATFSIAGSTYPTVILEKRRPD